jgi:CRP-like cAMP-binding protein
MPELLTSIRTAVNRVFRRQEDARLREMADFLETVPLFTPLSRGMLIETAEAIHERTYGSDEYLYYEGDPGIGLYVVRSGAIRLTVASPDGPEEEIARFGPGDVIGASCLVGGGVIRRSETAQAMADSVVLGLFSPEFRTLLRRHPKTGAALATLMARHFAQCAVASREIHMMDAGVVAAARRQVEAEATASGRADTPFGW